MIRLPARHISKVRIAEAVIEAQLRSIDYIRTAFSLASGALKDPFVLALNLWPYLALLASFAAFVLWNGGVVLGKLLSHHASYTQG
jgi:DIE2/ALG10 family